MAKLVDEIVRLFGPIDAAKTAEIEELAPGSADLEEAAMCLGGNRDVWVKSAHHVSAIAEQIVEILRED